MMIIMDKAASSSFALTSSLLFLFQSGVALGCLRQLIFFICLGTLTLVSGCGHTESVSSGYGDQPVPREYPRAELRVRLDLYPSPSCEEFFDVALYHHRGVELVQWDANRSSCAHRLITIRYIPTWIQKAELMITVQQLSLSTQLQDTP